MQFGPTFVETQSINEPINALRPINSRLNRAAALTSGGFVTHILIIGVSKDLCQFLVRHICEFGEVQQVKVYFKGGDTAQGL